MEKKRKSKVRFIVVREFSGEKTMREAFEQLISTLQLAMKISKALPDRSGE